MTRHGTGPGRRAPSLRVLACVACLANAAGAVSPYEYPDNGTVQFARGGAWLALATEPIAAHYNPAALSTQPSAVSVDLRLNYQLLCFDRHGPGGAPQGPVPGREYREACNDRQAFPLAIPALAVTARLSPRLALGFAVTPPSAYGTADGEWSATERGFNTSVDPETGEPFGPEQVPSPYRFLVLGNQSTLLFPTVSFGYEAAPRFRVGAGFISGIGVIDVKTMGMSSVRAGAGSDDALQDSFSHLRARDLFVPGAVVSLHWSVTRSLDIAAWGRFLDSVRTSTGSIEVRTQYYGRSTSSRGQPSYSYTNPVCVEATTSDCGARTAIKNAYPRGLERFELPLPPEVRLGARYHLPRSRGPAPAFGTRDPLRDDVFDVELDASYTWNGAADTVIVRFPATEQGTGALPVAPVGALPPNADRSLGFRHSIGFRLGGQINAVRDRLAVLAGGWFESRSQDPRFMNLNPPGPLRGGFGGGVLIRQGFVDLVFGYQRHVSAALDNGGRGGLRAPAAIGDEGFSLGEEAGGATAETRTQFRTPQTVNDGRITQSAHVFAAGAVLRF